MTKTKFYELTLINLKRIRRILGANQQDFARIIGIQRPDYNKRETGKTPMTIDELGKLIEFYQISISDLFRGYQIINSKNNMALNKNALEAFPFFNQIIILANQIADNKDDIDIKTDINFLYKSLQYSLDKVKKII